MRSIAARTVAIVAFALATMATTHAAGDTVAGRRKVAQCQACHGLDGLSKMPDAPHLAGQPEPYLVKSLNDYRKGLRKHETMSIAAQTLSDQDVADLAAYYSGIAITVTPPAR